jgi:hypothetical protein
MLRAPMSRINVLDDAEISEINNKSKLVKKYNAALGGGSAHEIMNKKTQEKVHIQETKVMAQKPVSKAKSEPMSDTTKRIIKVLTSATYIRGALGVLSKMFKK